MTVLRSMKDFSSMNITASILLFVTAIAAAVIANSPAASVYQEFLSHELHFRIGGFNLLSHAGHNLTMIEFINDGLMTIFFLMVGLEIKRVLLVGELSSFRKAALPFIAACGGMVVPVVIYSMVCAPGTEGGQGLAIPMATDIAFSLGVLSLLGKRVPLSLKIFLTANCGSRIFISDNSIFIFSFDRWQRTVEIENITGGIRSCPNNIRLA